MASVTNTPAFKSWLALNDICDTCYLWNGGSRPHRCDGRDLNDRRESVIRRFEASQK